jgi:hypothetical protein
MTAHTVDSICVLRAATLPIPLILRWNRLGIALGTLVVWSVLIVAGELLSAMDPTRDGRVVDCVWLLFGWIGGLIYCVPIYLIKRVVVCLGRCGKATEAAGTAGPRSSDTISVVGPALPADGPRGRHSRPCGNRKPPAGS